jgi:hypothetical protein
MEENMQRVMLALGWFVSGACCGFVALSLVHTPTWVQASQQGSVGIASPSSEPAVPPLRNHMIGGSIVGFAVQSLDGLDCDGCVISVEKFTYAGGAVRLNNAQLRSNTPIELKGAAANTINLLRAIGALPNPVPPQQPQGKPPMMTEVVKAQNSFNLVSVEGTK